MFYSLKVYPVVQPERKYQFTIYYKFSIGFLALILGNQFMHEFFTNLRFCIQYLEWF